MYVRPKGWKNGEVKVILVEDHAPRKGTERAKGEEFQADGSARKAKATVCTP